MAEVVRAVVDHICRLGGRPFVVPAMGSHAGGTAEGQATMLATLGIDESTCGCEVRSSMDVVELFTSKLGFPVVFDRHAAEADHVVVCNRVKPHTVFAGPVESGLAKMLLVGLGKRQGAATCHLAFAEYGFSTVIESVLPELIERSRLLAGVAVVENARDEPARIAAVAPHVLVDRETELLEHARALMARLPFDDVDLLLIDRIGKNISGGGFDSNVVGRKGALHEPRGGSGPTVRTIAVRGLTAETHGNAMGIGLAELCRSRMVRAMDVEASRLNAVTAVDLPTVMIPLDYETDREIIDVALGVAALRGPDAARVLWIRDTLHLEIAACSSALLAEASARDDIDVIGTPWTLPFDSGGNLPDDLETVWQGGFR